MSHPRNILLSKKKGGKPDKCMKGKVFKVKVIWPHSCNISQYKELMHVQECLFVFLSLLSHHTPHKLNFVVTQLIAFTSTVQTHI
jgi:hypothetical protein